MSEAINNRANNSVTYKPHAWYKENTESWIQFIKIGMSVMIYKTLFLNESSEALIHNFPY